MTIRNYTTSNATTSSTLPPFLSLFLSHFFSLFLCMTLQLLLLLLHLLFESSMIFSLSSFVLVDILVFSKRKHSRASFLFRFVNTSTPSVVHTIVCSYCALKLPSLVLLPSSGHNSSRHSLPRLIIGSMVNAWPGFMAPEALLPL